MSELKNVLDSAYNAMQGSEVSLDYSARHGIASQAVLTITDDDTASRVADYLAPRIERKTVVEIGGGIGLLALHMGHIAKRVYCIEANPMWSSVFVWTLLKSKPRNVSFLFGTADEFVGAIKADVAIFGDYAELDYRRGRFYRWARQTALSIAVLIFGIFEGAIHPGIAVVFAAEASNTPNFVLSNIKDATYDEHSATFIRKSLPIQIDGGVLGLQGAKLSRNKPLAKTPINSLSMNFWREDRIWSLVVNPALPFIDLQGRFSTIYNPYSNPSWYCVVWHRDRIGAAFSRVDTDCLNEKSGSVGGVELIAGESDSLVRQVRLKPANDRQNDCEHRDDDSGNSRGCLGTKPHWDRLTLWITLYGLLAFATLYTGILCWIVRTRR